MTRPGIEPRSPGLLANTLLIKPIDQRYFFGDGEQGVEQAGKSYYIRVYLDCSIVNLQLISHVEMYSHMSDDMPG